jgi:hypothetical protein
MTQNHPPNAPPQQLSILERILEEAHTVTSSGQRFLAVFDLDSTLFDLSLRIMGILDCFADDPRNQSLFPEGCAALKRVQFLRQDWGIDEPLARVGITRDSHPDFSRALHQHWAYHFFSDRYLHCDQPLPGAVEYVRELHRIGAEIMYLTGRDIPRMLEGTQKSLRNCGFPLELPRTNLVLKPSVDLEDAAFKVRILKEAEPTFQRIWLFENEPVNLNLVSRHCPEIGLVFIDSTHSGLEKVAEHLDRIEHFEVDLAEFRKYLGR